MIADSEGAEHFLVVWKMLMDCEQDVNIDVCLSVMGLLKIGKLQIESVWVQLKLSANEILHQKCQLFVSLILQKFNQLEIQNRLENFYTYRKPKTLFYG